MPPKVPTTEIGKASAGIRVAVTFRRKRKITRTTRPTVSIKVYWTSSTAWRIETERSNMTDRSTEAGICARKVGTSAFTLSTTSMVLASGCRKIASRIERLPLNQAET